MRVILTQARLTSYLFLAAAAALGLPSCDGPGYPPYDRTQLLREVTDSLILPAIDEAATRSGDLRTATSALCAAPSATTLASARTAWVDALVAWNGTIAYQVGPARTLDLHAHADWPADLAMVDATVAGTTVIDAAFVDTLGLGTRGFAPLEYLLFAYPGYTAPDDAMTLAALGDARRCTYAAMLADEIARIAEQLRTAWSASGGNYQDAFVNASNPNEFSTPQDAVNALVSQVIEAIDQVRDDKLGTPLGRTTHVGGVQSPYAHASVAAMEACFGSASDAWFGTPHGLDAFLRTRNTQLADTVMMQFASAEASVAALESPPLTPVYESYVAGTDHTVGNTAYDRVQALQTSLSTDVGATLGLSLMLPGDGD